MWPFSAAEERQASRGGGAEEGWVV